MLAAPLGGGEVLPAPVSAPVPHPPRLQVPGLAVALPVPEASLFPLSVIVVIVVVVLVQGPSARDDDGPGDLYLLQRITLAPGVPTLVTPATVVGDVAGAATVSETSQSVDSEESQRTLKALIYTMYLVGITTVPASVSHLPGLGISKGPHLDELGLCLLLLLIPVVLLAATV